MSIEGGNGDNREDNEDLSWAETDDFYQEDQSPISPDLENDEEIDLYLSAEIKTAAKVLSQIEGCDGFIGDAIVNQFRKDIKDSSVFRLREGEIRESLIEDFLKAFFATNKDYSTALHYAVTQHKAGISNWNNLKEDPEKMRLVAEVTDKIFKIF